MTKTDPKRLAQNRAWRARNAAYDRARSRKWRADNRDRVLEQKREYYQRVRKERDKTEEGRFKDREKKARRRAAVSGRTVTPSEWAAICAAHDHRCAYCYCKPPVLEMDHVIPLSKGGKHVASNIVPACKPCNSSKGNR